MIRRALTVCVGYDDLLSIVLPRNARHFDYVLVISDFRDEATKRIVQSVPNAVLYQTEAFYQYGAAFNKGAAIEEGLDYFGRAGWLCIFDADTLLPEPELDWSGLRSDSLHTPRRYMLPDPSTWTPTLDWSTLQLTDETEWAGYCQIFNCQDSRLVNRRPWYGTNWRHAGGCDSDFQAIWPDSHKHRPAFNVLHLGLDNKNWCGRATPRIDDVPNPLAAENAAKMAELMHNRRVRGDYSFRLEKL